MVLRVNYQKIRQEKKKNLMRDKYKEQIMKVHKRWRNVEYWQSN